MDSSKLDKSMKVARYEECKTNETNLEVTERVWGNILALNQNPPPTTEVFEFLSEYAAENRDRLQPDYMTYFPFVPRTMLMLIAENEVLTQHERRYIYKEMVNHIHCSVLSRSPIAKSVLHWYHDGSCVLQAHEECGDFVEMLIPAEDPEEDAETGTSNWHETNMIQHHSHFVLKHISYTVFEIAFFMDRPRDAYFLSKLSGVSLFESQYDPILAGNVPYPPPVLVALFNGYYTQLESLYPTFESVPDHFRNGIVYAGETALTYTIYYILCNVVINTWPAGIVNVPDDREADSVRLVDPNFALSAAQYSTTFSSFYDILRLLIIRWNVSYVRQNDIGQNALGLTMAAVHNHTILPKTLLFVRALLTRCLIEHASTYKQNQ